MTKDLRPRVYLKAGRSAALLRRHPWIFSGAIERLDGKPSSGTLVDVYDQPGSLVGVGHYSDQSIAVKILAFEAVSSIDELLKHRIAEAITLRDRLGLMNSSSTTAYRLINSEGDGLPGLIVDRYAQTLVMQFHSAGMFNLKSSIGEILTSLMGNSIDTILWRASDDSSEGFLLGTAETGQILEHNLMYKVDWTRGQKTGFFLDQRENRDLVRSYSNGKHILNCFAYTGAFSVAALAGGAASVCSVDSSASALKLLEENIKFNFPEAKHETVQADCLHYLKDLKQKFDLIVLDPPAFVKHRSALTGGIKGYEMINTAALNILQPNGILFTFSCSQAVDRNMFWDLLQQSALRAGRRAQVLHELRQAPCHPVSIFHPEANYLKGLVLRVS